MNFSRNPSESFKIYFICKIVSNLRNWFFHDSDILTKNGCTQKIPDIQYPYDSCFIDFLMTVQQLDSLYIDLSAYQYNFNCRYQKMIFWMYMEIISYFLCWCFFEVKVIYLWFWFQKKIKNLVFMMGELLDKQKFNRPRVLNLLCNEVKWMFKVMILNPIDICSMIFSSHLSQAT